MVRRLRPAPNTTTQSARMAAEHILAARRRREERANAIGQLLDLGLGDGAMGAEAGQDHRLAALAQQCRRRLDGLGTRRRRGRGAARAAAPP